MADVISVATPDRPRAFNPIQSESYIGLVDLHCKFITPLRFSCIRGPRSRQDLGSDAEIR